MKSDLKKRINFHVENKFGFVILFSIINFIQYQELAYIYMVKIKKRETEKKIESGQYHNSCKM